MHTPFILTLGSNFILELILRNLTLPPFNAILFPYRSIFFDIDHVR